MRKFKNIFLCLIFIACNQAKHLASNDKTLLHYTRAFYYQMGWHYSVIAANDKSADTGRDGCVFNSRYNDSSAKYLKKYLGDDTLKYHPLSDSERQAFFSIACSYYYNNNYEQLLSLCKIIMRFYSKENIRYNIEELFDKGKEHYCSNSQFDEKYETEFRNLLGLNVNEKYSHERKILEETYDKDQKYRKPLLNKNNEMINEDSFPKGINDSIASADSADILVVSGLIKKHGWLGINDIGAKAYKGEFFVIQHTDSTVSLSYYPIIKKAYEQGKLNEADYELYIDRMNVYLHKYQIYGTQSYYDSSMKKWVKYPIKRN